MNPENNNRGNPESDVLFQAVVDRVAFHDKDSGFAVLKVSASQKNQIPDGASSTTIVGVLAADIDVGAYVVARGAWQEHPRFGKQFRARSVTESEPTGEEAIKRYLASSIDGVGPVLAERIVECFGEETLDVLDGEPERLREVPGIGEKKFDELVTSIGDARAKRDVMLFFETYAIPSHIARKVYQTYGDRSIEVVSKNPYELTGRIWGIGFKTADRVGLALGLKQDSTFRIAAGLMYTLQRSSDDGHCYLGRDELFQRASKLLSVSETESLEHGLQHALGTGNVIEDEECYYLPDLYNAERKVSKLLVERLATLESPALEIEESVVADAITRPISGHADAAGVIRLSEQQAETLRMAAENSLLVITGGPGCGKTTVVRSIASLFKRVGHRLKLCAPTGRASQRLSEVCGVEATTIHRLLKFDPMSRSFRHDRHDPLEADVVIVDEASMIDVSLAADLLDAITPGARVIFVGDADQLPSVGPGRVLSDMLTISKVPRMRLTTLFRRESGSSITHIAHAVNTGITPTIPRYQAGENQEAFFVHLETPAKAAEAVERLVCNVLPEEYGFSAKDITVLSPMNQGELGIISLNKRLQERLVPALPGTPRVEIGTLQLRLGDRVCQRVNNYNITAQGVFNGDQGEIIGIDSTKRSIHVRLWDGREVEYESDYLTQLDLAYALTVHRSQGSEVPAVVMLLHQSHSVLLERQLFYTGITRAKKLLAIVGTSKALQMATKRNPSRKRNTRMANRVSEGLAYVD